MRGVSTPTHEYARVAAMYLHSLKMPTTHRDPAIRQLVQRFVVSTRAYNRVLLRLRAQVEKEAETSLQPLPQAQTQSPVARAVNARVSSTDPRRQLVASVQPSTFSGGFSIPLSMHPMGNAQFPGSASEYVADEPRFSFPIV
jgi:hypothetical protein